MSPWKAGLWMVRLPPMLEDNEKTLDKVYIMNWMLSSGENYMNWIITWIACFLQGRTIWIELNWIDLNRIVIHWNKIAKHVIIIELCIHCWTVVFTVLLMTLQAELPVPVVQRPRRQRRRPIRFLQEDWMNGCQSEATSLASFVNILNRFILI